MEDGRIAAGIARRLRLARGVAEAKRAARLPLRDYPVERLAVGRWVARLASIGIPPGRSAALARWLIEESVRVQESFRSKVGGPPRGDHEITVVGGAGAMGRWLSEFFEAEGHRVAVVDPRGAPNGRRRFSRLETAARRSDALVFATPIRATAPLLRRAFETRTEALVFDVLSVKEPILPLLRAGVRAGIRLTSVHPMFGPSARTLSGRNLLIVRCGNREADAAARSLFSSSALSIAEVPLRDHDRLIAESLGLSHALNLLFLGALGRTDTRAPELGRAASTTFHRQSSLALAVASEAPELYLDIQALNPHSPRVYSEMERSLRTLQRTVALRDAPAFRRLLEAGKAKLEAGPAPMRT